MNSFNIVLLTTSFLTPIINTVFSSILPTDYTLYIYMFVLVLIDTIFGVIVAYKKKNINSTDYGRVIGKICLYWIIMIIITSDSKYTELMFGDFSNVVESMVMSFMFSREFLSLLEKAEQLKIIKLPKIIKDKLKIYNYETKNDVEKNKDDNENDVDK